MFYIVVSSIRAHIQLCGEAPALFPVVLICGEEAGHVLLCGEETGQDSGEAAVQDGKQGHQSWVQEDAQKSRGDAQEAAQVEHFCS